MSVAIARRIGPGGAWPILAAGILAAGAGTLAVAAGPSRSLLALLGPLLFLVAAAAFVAAPHIAVAVMIPLLAVVPAAKIFVAPWLGVTKEVLIAAALAATTVVVMRRRSLGQRQGGDRLLAAIAAAFLLVQVANVAGPNDAAWLNLVRLIAQPLGWLVIGMLIDPTGRALRWACGSLVATGCAMALVGLAQQAIGPQGLVDLGYRWNIDVRLVGGNLRSFGTLDEAFQYAGMILLAGSVALMWQRPGAVRTLTLALLALGLAVSFVRTAAVITLALVVLVAVRHGRRHLAVGLVAASIAALVLLVGRTGVGEPAPPRPLLTEEQTLTNLNGRVRVWADAIEGPENLALGRGVGVVGGRQTLGPGGQRDPDAVQPGAGVGYADSSYIATLAGSGIVGLALLLAILGRIATRARRAIRRGDERGWLLAGCLTTVVVDASTRDSLWGFPNAIVSFLVIGLCVGEIVRRETRARAALE